MIELYAAATGNSLHTAIALEEAGVSYSHRKLDLASGEQEHAVFLARTPPGRVPPIVGYGSDDSDRLVVTQSAAIVRCVAEKNPILVPTNRRQNAAANECFAVSYTDDVAPTTMALFLRRDKHLDTVTAESWIDRRAKKILSYAEAHLGSRRYFADDRFSIGNIAAYPKVAALASFVQGHLPSLCRCYERAKERPAVASARRILFGIEKYRLRTFQPNLTQNQSKSWPGISARSNT